MGYRSLFSLGGPCNDGVIIKDLHRPAPHSSFPIGLVKTESIFIVRLVETGLGRWLLVGAVINANAFPFLTFSDLTGYLEYTGIRVFWTTWK